MNILQAKGPCSIAAGVLTFDDGTTLDVAAMLAALRDCKSAIHHFLQADDQATQDNIMDLASACATARAAIAAATKE